MYLVCRILLCACVHDVKSEISQVRNFAWHRSAVSQSTHRLRNTVAKRTRLSWWYRLKWLSSEVIWIFCNHRNKKLKQMSLPTNSKLNSYSLISAALLLCRGRRWGTVLPSTNSIKTCNALEAGTWPRTKTQIIIRVLTVKGVRKRGLGLNPPWAWYFTKTWLPAQRRWIVFAYFLLVNLSNQCKYHGMNLHANFKEHCKWAKK